MLCPEKNCPLCPRLVAFRTDNRQKFSSFYNAPVPPFGPSDARLLILGMAPGLKGANQTGRPFTNDYAGDLLYPVLKKYGFATGNYGKRADDGYRLVDARVTNSVRCVPPQSRGRRSQQLPPFSCQRVGSSGQFENYSRIGRRSP